MRQVSYECVVRVLPMSLEKSGWVLLLGQVWSEPEPEWLNLGVHAVCNGVAACRLSLPFPIEVPLKQGTRRVEWLKVEESAPRQWVGRQGAALCEVPKYPQLQTLYVYLGP